MKRFDFRWCCLLILSSGLLHAGEAELKASAQAFLAAKSALDKTVELEKKWNARWSGKRVSSEEKKESDEELSQLREISEPVSQNTKEAFTQFKAQIEESGIEIPDGVSWTELARRVAGGTISVQSTSKKSEGSSGISSISANVIKRSSLPETSSQTGYVYDVQVTVALSSPSNGYTEVALSTEGEAASSEGGAPILGNNGLVLKPGMKSVAGTIKIKSYVAQRITLTGKVGESSGSVTVKLK